MNLEMEAEVNSEMASEAEVNSEMEADVNSEMASEAEVNLEMAYF